LGLASQSAARALPRTMSDAATDPRVDVLLQTLLQRAENPLAPQFDVKPASAEDLPVNLDPARARPDSRAGVMIEGHPDPEALRAVGVEVHTVAGDVITADIPLAVVPAALNVPGVERITASRPLQQASDTSVPDTDAPSLW